MTRNKPIPPGTEFGRLEAGLQGELSFSKVSHNNQGLAEASSQSLVHSLPSNNRKPLWPSGKA